MTSSIADAIFAWAISVRATTNDVVEPLCGCRYSELAAGKISAVGGVGGWGLMVT